MTSRVGLIGLAGLACLALSTSVAEAQTTRSTGGVVFSDITISSMRGGRTVATTRTDRQGGFRFELPAGDYDICLNGPGLRSVIDRSGGGQGEDHIIGVLIGLLLPAVQHTTTTELPFPRARSGGSGRAGPLASPRPARNICFPYTVRVAVGDVNGDGTADRRVDPRIPPPGSRSAPARAGAPQTVAVAGTVSLVR